MLNVTALTGKNSFALQAALKDKVNAFVDANGDLALETIDLEEQEVSALAAALSSPGFLSPQKMVVVHSPSKNKQFIEGFEKVLEEVADGVEVLAVDPQVDKRTAWYKWLKKHADLHESADLDERGLVAWACDYAKDGGGELSRADARVLVQRIGTNQRLLANELDKLLAYDPKITKKTIELLCEPLPQSSVFDLLEAALAGNKKRVTELFDEQRRARVEPQAIMGLIGWQMHVLAIVATAGDRSSSEIAKAAKLNPFVVQKSMPLAKKRGPAAIKQLVQQATGLDMRLKSTSVNAHDAVLNFLLAM